MRASISPIATGARSVARIEVGRRPGERDERHVEARLAHAATSTTGTGLAQPKIGACASASIIGTSNVPDRIDMADRIERQPPASAAVWSPQHARDIAVRDFVKHDRDRPAGSARSRRR